MFIRKVSRSKAKEKKAKCWGCEERCWRDREVWWQSEWRIGGCIFRWNTKIPSLPPLPTLPCGGGGPGSNEGSTARDGGKFRAFSHSANMAEFREMHFRKFSFLPLISRRFVGGGGVYIPLPNFRQTFVFRSLQSHNLICSSKILLAFSAGQK